MDEVDVTEWISNIPCKVAEDILSVIDPSTAAWHFEKPKAYTQAKADLTWSLRQLTDGKSIIRLAVEIKCPCK